MTPEQSAALRAATRDITGKLDEFEQCSRRIGKGIGSRAGDPPLTGHEQIDGLILATRELTLVHIEQDIGEVREAATRLIHAYTGALMLLSSLAGGEQVLHG